MKTKYKYIYLIAGILVIVGISLRIIRFRFIQIGDNDWGILLLYAFLALIAILLIWIIVKRFDAFPKNK